MISLASISDERAEALFLESICSINFETAGVFMINICWTLLEREVMQRSISVNDKINR